MIPKVTIDALLTLTAGPSIFQAFYLANWRAEFTGKGDDTAAWLEGTIEAVAKLHAQDQAAKQAAAALPAMQKALADLKVKLTQATAYKTQHQQAGTPAGYNDAIMAGKHILDQGGPDASAKFLALLSATTAPQTYGYLAAMYWQWMVDQQQAAIGQADLLAKGVPDQLASHDWQLKLFAAVLSGQAGADPAAVAANLRQQHKDAQAAVGKAYVAVWTYITQFGDGDFHGGNIPISPDIGNVSPNLLPVDASRVAGLLLASAGIAKTLIDHATAQQSAMDAVLQQASAALAGSANQFDPQIALANLLGQTATVHVEGVAQLLQAAAQWLDTAGQCATSLQAYLGANPDDILAKTVADGIKDGTATAAILQAAQKALGAAQADVIKYWASFKDKAPKALQMGGPGTGNFSQLQADAVGNNFWAAHQIDPTAGLYKLQFVPDKATIGVGQDLTFQLRGLWSKVLQDDYQEATGQVAPPAEDYTAIAAVKFGILNKGLHDIDDNPLPGGEVELVGPGVVRGVKPGYLSLTAHIADLSGSLQIVVKEAHVPPPTSSSTSSGSGFAWLAAAAIAAKLLHFF